jgi:ABC-type sugar transport system ATPase subunit
LVTHDQAEALAMADRVAVFSTGELQQFATPDDLYRRPANAFVARFVGHPPMNLLDGEFANGQFAMGDVRIPVPRGHPEGPGSLGIRPEDATLDGETPVRTVVLETLGRGGHSAGARKADVGAHRQAIAEPGQRFARIRPDRVHFFDQGGTRIGL